MKHLLVLAITATALSLANPAYGGSETDAVPAERALLKEACETKDKPVPTAGAKVDLYDYRVTVSVSPAIHVMMQDTAFDGPTWRKTLDCEGSRALAARITGGKIELRFQALVPYPDPSKDPRYVAFSDTFALKDLKKGAITREKDGVSYRFDLKT
ncbi:hypothetical protein [Asticcacaulis sp.]|uniref:hypothetical protein n=1 Tax=Asticcacaulis sp. TaxID=1872648 RepID=UPI00260D711F|nr:hypothetical protein [Asticcacaulis sp.]